MSDELAISRLIQRLKEGDECAANELCDAYFGQLVEMARRRMSAFPRRTADEEDVAIGVFKSLWQGAIRGHFPELADRNDLWHLLLAITKQKIVDEVRRSRAQKRGEGKVRGDSVFARVTDGESPNGFDCVDGDHPAPEFATVMDEQLEQLLMRLRDDSLRDVARWRMEGYTNAEIAERLDLGERSVERKLQLIREKWSKELQP